MRVFVNGGDRAGGKKKISPRQHCASESRASARYCFYSLIFRTALAISGKRGKMAEYFSQSL